MRGAADGSNPLSSLHAGRNTDRLLTITMTGALGTMGTVQPALRVVSLLPSATELIAVVLEHKTPGDGDREVILVGRSHECDAPPALVDALPMLTASKIAHTDPADIDRQVREQLAAGAGLYSVDAPRLRALRPDIIVTQSLCKVCSVDYCLVESIAAGLDQDPKPVVVDTNPTSLADVLRDVTRVGQALGMPAAAAKAVAALQARIDAAVATAAELQAAHPDGTPPSVLFCEWPEPVFCGGHWTPQLIHMAGGSHPLNPPQDGVGAPPSFVVTPDAIVASHPDVVIVAPCGYDLAETKKHLPSLVGQPWWGQLRAAREGNVWLVDGNQMFNRPGPRLVDALEWLVAVLHDRPDLAPPGFPAERWVKEDASA